MASTRRVAFLLNQKSNGTGLTRKLQIKVYREWSAFDCQEKKSSVNISKASTHFQARTQLYPPPARSGSPKRFNDAYLFREAHARGAVLPIQYSSPRQSMFKVEDRLPGELSDEQCARKPFLLGQRRLAHVFPDAREREITDGKLNLR